MKMDRRSFLKTLSVLAGSFVAPTAPAKPAPLMEAASPAASVDAAAEPSFTAWAIRSISLSSEPTVFDITTIDSPVTEMFIPTARSLQLRIDMFVDADTVSAIYDAVLAREPVPLDLPILRRLGIGKNDWIIEDFKCSVHHGDYMTANLVLVPTTQVLNGCPREKPQDIIAR